jgi:hypothetical protein
MCVMGIEWGFRSFWFMGKDYRVNFWNENKLGCIAVHEYWGV